MRRILIAGAAMAALLALPAAAGAQAKPNFSGSYTYDSARSDQPPAAAGRGGRGGGGRGGGMTVPTGLTISQTPTEITITRALPPNPLSENATTSAVYKLDGSESTNALGDVFLSRSKVSWDGAKMVITTSKDMGMGPNGPLAEDTKEVFSLEGGALTVVTTTHNSTSAAGDQTRKLVYTKKP